MWLAVTVVVAGLSPLAARVALSWANRPPSRPPGPPPPGRPFVATGVTLSEPPLSRPGLQAAVKGTNVVICVLDAARVDHFSGYGYPRETTPHFDRLAQEGLLFEQHFCEAPMTKPSTVSLLTGLYPDTHGLLLNGSTETLAQAGGGDVLTLEGAFARAGYATYLLSSHAVASPAFGVGTDFQHRRFLGWAEVAKPMDRVGWMRAELSRLIPRWKAAGRPVFAYLHVLPPHLPYNAPAEFRRRFQGQRPPRYFRSRPAWGAAASDAALGAPATWQEWGNLYDANLRWADSFVGDLEQALREAGLLRRTLLVVTADHGDALQEHTFAFHPTSPYDEDLHIPLLVRFPGPGRPAGRVHALSQTIDLLPTLLDLYQLPYRRTKVQGRSLLPLLEGRAKAVNDYVVSAAGSLSACYVLRDAHHTLLIRPGEAPRLLYDMDSDPWQTEDVYREQRAGAAELERDFAAYVRAQRLPPSGFPESPQTAAGAARPAPALSPEQRRDLRSLGYVQ